jgi:hypothetical protein
MTTTAPTNRIRVWPANDLIRKAIKHPSAGGFGTVKDFATWPRDAFTLRRLADGDVTDKAPAAKPATPSAAPVAAPAAPKKV